MHTIQARIILLNSDEGINVYNVGHVEECIREGSQCSKSRFK